MCVVKFSMGAGDESDGTMSAGGASEGTMSAGRAVETSNGGKVGASNGGVEKLHASAGSPSQAAKPVPLPFGAGWLALL